MPSTKTLLFFSRGKGRGHAVPDDAIVRELLVLQPDTEVVFISYSVGATVLRQLGWPVIELNLPEDPPLWDAVTQIVEVLRHYQPALVVSHEEFSVVPLSKAFGFQTVFLTDWFADPNLPVMQALRHADDIIFMDYAGYNEVPPYLTCKIHYTGCVFRYLENIEPARARDQLGIPDDATVILVAPGGAAMHSEEQAPVFDLILNAFEELEVSGKRLIYVVADFALDEDRRRTNRPGVVIMRPHGTFTTTMMASNLVITTGNRTPILECEALGIPSLSLSFGHNPIDDQRIARISTNTPLRARSLTPGLLKSFMLEAMQAKIARTAPRDTSRGRKATAQRLLSHLSENRTCSHIL